MATRHPHLSKAEWRQVADIAANIDWASYSAGRHRGGIDAGLNDRTADALRLLLRAA